MGQSQSQSPPNTTVLPTPPPRQQQRPLPRRLLTATVSELPGCLAAMPDEEFSDLALVYRKMTPAGKALFKAELARRDALFIDASILAVIKAVRRAMEEPELGRGGLSLGGEALASAQQDTSSKDQQGGTDCQPRHAGSWHAHTWPLTWPQTHPRTRDTSYAHFACIVRASRSAPASPPCASVCAVEPTATDDDGDGAAAAAAGVIVAAAAATGEPLLRPEVCSGKPPAPCQRQVQHGANKCGACWARVLLHCLCHLPTPPALRCPPLPRFPACMLCLPDSETEALLPWPTATSAPAGPAGARGYLSSGTIRLRHPAGLGLVV